MMIEAATTPTPLLVEVSAVVGSLVTIAMFGAGAFGFILFRVGAKRARWRPVYAGLGLWSAGTLIAGIVAAVRGELLEVGFATIFLLTSAGIWTQVVLHKRRLAALRAAKRADWLPDQTANPTACAAPHLHEVEHSHEVRSPCHASTK